jgi:pimeloyl-ACP methyl ester carboxylesterase
MTDTINLAYEHHQGTGPALLMVHGFLSGRGQWLANIDALSNVCQPVVVEMWGHGRSPSPDDPHVYTPAGYQEQFELIREQIGVERWFVCGYSLGAGLTIRYANAFPDRVLGHVFTNSTSAFADIAQSEEWERSAAASAERIIKGGSKALEKIPVHPRHARKLPADIYDALMADAALHDPLGIARTMEYTTPTVSIREEAEANRVPALLINGRFEKRFQPHREFVEENMSDVRIQDVDAGHAVNMEADAQFNQAVADFIGEQLRKQSV